MNWLTKLKQHAADRFGKYRSSSLALMFLRVFVALGAFAVVEGLATLVGLTVIFYMTSWPISAMTVIFTVILGWILLELDESKRKAAQIIDAPVGDPSCS